MVVKLVITESQAQGSWGQLARKSGQPVVTGFSPPTLRLLGIKLRLPDLTANQHKNSTAEDWPYVAIRRNFCPRDLKDIKDWALTGSYVCPATHECSLPRLSWKSTTAISSTHKLIKLTGSCEPLYVWNVMVLTILTFCLLTSCHWKFSNLLELKVTRC